MRIVVNDTAASIGGAMTVLKSFYEYVKENDRENEYVFLLSAPYLEETENIKILLIPSVKKSSFHKLWFDFVSGKKLLKELNPDRVLSLQNIITFGYKGEQCVYVHQSIPFQTEKKFSFLKSAERTLAVYQYLIGAIIKLSVKKAKRVFVQSEWMKANVAAQCNVDSDKVSVLSFPLSESEDSGEYCGKGNRFFYPTTTDAVYKNLSAIYSADAKLKNRGNSDYRITLTLDKPPIENSGIVFCGLLDKSDLYNEYRNSVLVFPSYIETIGLPLIEAMGVGAPIIAADCEYSREVLSGYKNVLFFNPFDSAELASCMEKSISGEFISDSGKKRKPDGSSSWKDMTRIIVSGE